MRVRTESELATMPAGKLKAYIAHFDQQESAMCDAMIAAGRGHEKGGETREKAKAGDPLAQRWVLSREAAMAAYGELQGRRRWHGKDHPIRKPAWLRT